MDTQPELQIQIARSDFVLWHHAENRPVTGDLWWADGLPSLQFELALTNVSTILCQALVNLTDFRRSTPYIPRGYRDRLGI